MADRLRTVLRDRPWPFHPLLFATYFVLFLYSVNLDEVELGDVLPVLAVVVGGTAVALIVAAMLVGDSRRAALILTAAVVAFLAYGHAARLLQPLRIGPTVHVLGWLTVIALAVILAWRGRRFLGTVTRALNVAAFALVIVPLLSIVPYDIGRLASGEEPTPAPSTSPTSPSTAGTRHLLVRLRSLPVGDLRPARLRHREPDLRRASDPRLLHR